MFPAEIQSILDMQYFGNTLQSYIIAIIIFVVLLSVLKIFKFVVLKKLRDLSKKTKNDIDDLAIDIIDSFGWPFFIIVSLYAAANYLVLNPLLTQALYYAVLLLGVFYFVKGIGKFIDFTSRKAAKKRKKEEEDADTSVIKLIGRIMKAVVWLGALLFILSSAGIDITGAMVGVGVSGIVIGFALQNVLVDLFASFSIYFDKPFQVGDFIIIGNDMGVVKKIGIKSTRIQTLQGQELVISNTELTSTRINNYKKMDKRRISFSLGVIYGTETKKMKKIPGIIKKIIESVELTTFDRCHFKSFGDFSLNYEIVYYLDSSDYNKYMDVQQEINLGIKDAFEKEGIEMAFPTQTVFLEKG